MARPGPTAPGTSRRTTTTTLRVVEPDEPAPFEITPKDVDRALAGDTDTMRALVGRLRPIIHAEVAWSLERFAPSGRGRDARQEVRDTVQEVFVALLEDDGKILRSWQPERGRSMVSFIRLVTRHQVASLVRSRRRCPWTEDPTPQESIPVGIEHRTEVRIESKDQARRIMDGLRATLSSQGMLMFHALYVEGHTVDEVCEEVGMTRAALYSWRRRLRQRIDELARRLGLEVTP